MACQATFLTEQVAAGLGVALDFAELFVERPDGPVGGDQGLGVIQLLLFAITQLAVFGFRFQLGHDFRKLQIIMAGVEQVVDDAVNFRGREVFLAGAMKRIRIVIAEAIVMRHFGVGPKFAGRHQPLESPFLVGLFADAEQARPDFTHGAGRVVRVGQQLGTLLRRQPLQGRIGLQAKVGSDGATVLIAVDFVAAEAAKLADQAIALEQLGGLSLVAV
jgi:hypothetical protein